MAEAKPFTPGWASTAVVGLLTAAFLGLGAWQMDRAAQKAARQRAFDEAPRLVGLPPAATVGRYSRVRLVGRFDTERHILLDNQVYRTHAGVHVLTPFHLADGRTLLVDRGWLPLAPDRRTLPEVPTPAGRITISGILDEPYRPGRRLGAPDRLARNDWPQLVTYPDLGDIAAALGTDLYPLVLLLGPEQPGGFADRAWKPVHTEANKHRARALQWFTFAAAAIVLWIYRGFKRGAGS